MTKIEITLATIAYAIPCLTTAILWGRLHLLREGTRAQAKRTYVRRDYRSPGESGDHLSYLGMVHDANDRRVDLAGMLTGSAGVDGARGLFEDAGVRDGDAFEISVRRTGSRPFRDRWVILQEPGRYAAETSGQEAFRVIKGRVWNPAKDVGVDVQ